MNADQIVDFEKRYLDKFKDTVSLKHKGFEKVKTLILRDEKSESKTVVGYDIFEITKADGTIQDIKVC